MHRDHSQLKQYTLPLTVWLPASPKRQQRYIFCKDTIFDTERTHIGSCNKRK